MPPQRLSGRDIGKLAKLLAAAFDPASFDLFLQGQPSIAEFTSLLALLRRSRLPCSKSLRRPTPGFGGRTY